MIAKITGDIASIAVDMGFRDIEIRDDGEDIGILIKCGMNYQNLKRIYFNFGNDNEICVSMYSKMVPAKITTIKIGDIRTWLNRFKVYAGKE